MAIVAAKEKDFHIATRIVGATVAAGIMKRLTVIPSSERLHESSSKKVWVLCVAWMMNHMITKKE
jgi:hypothetical protein